MFSRITRLAVALTASGALALAAAASAQAAISHPAFSAGVNPHAVETVASGAAGYSLTTGVPVRNAGVQIVGTPSMLNIGHQNGTSNTGGAGEQVCDPVTGFGIQAGEVSRGTSMDVMWAAGILRGAAADNCVGNALLPGADHLQTTSLTGIAPTDSVDVFISFRNVRVWVNRRHHRVRVWQGRAKVQAQDETAGFEVYASPWVHTQADWNMTEAGYGVQQETAGVSADTPLTCPDGTSGGPLLVTPCVPLAGQPAYNGTTGPHGTGAHGPLGCFAGFVNGVGLALPPISGPPIGAYALHEVATAGNGLNANAALVAPNNSLVAPAGFGHTPAGCPMPDLPATFGPFQFAFGDYVGNVTH